MENMGEDIGMLCSDSDNCLPEEMATPSKRPKLSLFWNNQVNFNLNN